MQETSFIGYLLGREFYTKSHLLFLNVYIFLIFLPILKILLFFINLPNFWDLVTSICFKNHLKNFILAISVFITLVHMCGMLCPLKFVAPLVLLHLNVYSKHIILELPLINMFITYSFPECLIYMFWLWFYKPCNLKCNMLYHAFHCQFIHSYTKFCLLSALNDVFTD